MATLKAARDAVNIRTYNDNDTYLLILGTGSHRSMVTSMATRSSQPFFGSVWIEFPPLEEDYVEWEVKRLKDASSSLMPKLPTVAALNLGFKLLGSRPKDFHQALVSMQEYAGQDRDSAFELLCRNIAKIALLIDWNSFICPLVSVRDFLPRSHALVLRELKICIQKLLLRA